MGWPKPPESVGHFASQVRGEMASLDQTKFLEYKNSLGFSGFSVVLGGAQWFSVVLSGNSFQWKFHLNAW